MPKLLLFIFFSVTLLSYTEPALARTPYEERLQREGERTCVQAARTRRTDSLKAAREDYHAARRDALERRRQSLAVAARINDRRARLEAREMARDIYTTEIREIQRDYQASRQAIVRDYTAEQRACRARYYC